MWPLLLLSAAVHAGACPSMCSCLSNTVICTGQQLVQIPSGIPEDTVRLDLQENRIGTIKKGELSRLKHLKILQLMDNNIHTIEEGAFHNLVHLERLRLNRNRLHSLPDAVFQNLVNLHRLVIHPMPANPFRAFRQLAPLDRASLSVIHLNTCSRDLSENYFTSLSDDQLRGPTNMLNLQLDKNNLVCLETTVISTWSSLEIFTINNNNLTTLEEIEFKPNLRTLRIGDNPWQCDCRLKWIKRSFVRHTSGGAKCSRPALLHGKLLDTVEESLLKCSGIEKRAVVSCKEARVCPPVCTCTETTVDCRDRGLTHIPTNLPLSTTELRLEQNQITYIPPKAFENLKKLQRLDLSKNQLQELSPGAFVGLTGLNSLVLYGNNLTDLPINAFEGLGNLQLLLLNANQLHCLRKGLLDPLENLNLLSLYDNQIKSVSRATFQKLSKLQTLHLAKNPLICDCNMEWLAELNAKVNMETSGARCEAPKRVAKKRFASLHPSKFRCKGSEVLVTQKADECFIDSDCPQKCNCFGTSVDCSNRGLVEVPQEIPSYTTELNLSGNQITEMTKDGGFEGLPQLVNLDLSNNGLRIIEETALPQLDSLVELKLSGNELNFLPTAIPIQCKNLEILDLSNNRLKCLSSGVLTSLYKLKKIQVHGNPIQCDCHIAPLIEWMRSNGSRIIHHDECASIYKNHKTGLENLQCKEPFDSICTESGNYCPPGCSCNDNIVRCSQKELSTFPSGLPIETVELFLDSNSITHIPPDEISRLPNLVKLDMSHNQLQSIENHVFTKLSRLSTLILSYNKIRCLQPFAFDGLTSLRILSLHGNDISVLPESAFTSLGNITHIAVGSNSLHCDCRMAWFSRWIKSKFVEAGIARCNSPQAVENQLLLTAHQYQFICAGEEPKQVAAKCNMCLLEPCKNEASCKPVGGSDYSCQCTAGFHGRNCDQQIDACYGHPCLNHAVCKVLEEGRFKCVCPKGFTGDYCETNVNDCKNNKCQNGAACVDLINSYRCDCPTGFGGKYCEDKYELCSKEFNPCANGSKCIPKEKDDYRCECLVGFHGTNCTENKDDCQLHDCQNGGSCVDGIASYSCLCASGFTGKRCEIPPMIESFFQNTAQCHSASCGHGSCVLNEKLGESECRCHEGYEGKQCDRLMSIGFQGSNSFVALEPWDTQDGTISFTLRTTNETGLILYYGDEHYLSMELYDGRIKTAFYLGNHPASHMYSFVTVNDGFAHNVLLQVKGNRLTLSVDDQQPQSVTNDGKVDHFELESKQYLYIGGLPDKSMSFARESFRIKSGKSMLGCVSKMTVNGVPINFATAIEKKDTVAGCSKITNMCIGVYCGNGRCVTDSSSNQGFVCRCDPQFEGAHCEKRSVSCNKEKFRGHHTEKDCRSVVEIKNAECIGYCGEGENCCAAVKVKKRKVKMLCKDGTSYTSMVNIVRKCQCANTCTKKSLLLL